jgi:hypothetical protein
MDHGQKRAAANEEFSCTLKDATASNTEKRAGVSGLLSKAESAKQAADRATFTTAHISKLVEEASEKEKIVVISTTAMEKLDDLKRNMLSTFPIPGVTFENGEAIVDGVPMEMVNHARKVQIAMDVAALRAGASGPVCLDGAESLDSDTLALVQDAAARRDVQLFLTKVADSPWTVVTE